MNCERWRCSHLEVGSWKYKVEIGSAEVGSWKLEVGSWKYKVEIGSAIWKLESRNGMAPIGHGSNSPVTYLLIFRCVIISSSSVGGSLIVQ